MATKEELLKILESNKGESISGQRLAEKFSVSRAAIWKIVNGLKKDGYKIYATPNKGYMMDKQNDILSQEGIRVFLSEEYKDCAIYIYDSVDSTNIQAKKLVLEEAGHGSIVLANSQTVGRGRLGRSFFSPAQTGLYMSLVLRPNRELSNSVLTTVAAAVAVCFAIEKLTNESPQIKWVNDIFLRGKKVCGILTEAVSDFETGLVESIVVGIGVNLTTEIEHFPEELREIAGSVFSKDISRNLLTAYITDNLLDLEKNLADPVLIGEYKKRSMIIGKDIVYQRNGKDYQGHVLDINNRGNLIVRTSSGDVVLESGEVTIRKTCL